jgi:hypothetical protein
LHHGFDDNLFRRWLQAFIITLVIEVPFYVALARGIVPAWRAALAGAACSFITHPVLVYFWRPFCQQHGFSYTEYIVIGELAVGVIETFTFFALARPVRLVRALACSFVANAASYGGGNLLHWLGLWR